MVQKRKRQGYSIGMAKKERLLFTDLCTMYFKLYLKNERKIKDVSVNSYIRKLTPMLSYGMELGYI